MSFLHTSLPSLLHVILQVHTGKSTPAGVRGPDTVHPVFANEVTRMHEVMH